MDFAGVNYVAIMLAAAASFIFGGLWYGMLSKQWMEAADLKIEDIKPPNGPLLAPYINTFFAELIMAFMLAGVIGHVTAGQFTLPRALSTATMIWLGFIMASLVVNHSFQGAKKALTFIDGGHWLGALLVQAAVIAWMGPRL